MANSNCQAWNICTEAEPDTDRAVAEAGDGLGSDGDAARGKTAIRVASDATSGADEADNGTVARGHPPPGAGGNLEMCGVLLLVMKQEGDIHVNIRVNVAGRTTASLAHLGQTFQFD